MKTRIDLNGKSILVTGSPGFIGARLQPSAASWGLEEDYGFRPQIGIKEGLKRFCEWYAKYYK